MATHLYKIVIFWSVLSILTSFSFDGHCQAPVLQSPKHNATLYKSDFAFGWNPAQMDSSQIQIAKDSAFTQLFLDSLLGSGNTHILQVPREIGDYFWRVRQYENLAWSNWSNALSFKVFLPAYADTGLIAWYASDSGLIDSAGYVIGWNDRSGNNLHATSQGQGTKPGFISSNPHFGGFPSAKFEVDKFLQLPWSPDNLSEFYFNTITYVDTPRNTNGPIFATRNNPSNISQGGMDLRHLRSNSRFQFVIFSNVTRNVIFNRVFPERYPIHFNGFVDSSGNFGFGAGGSFISDTGATFGPYSNNLRLGNNYATSRSNFFQGGMAELIFWKEGFADSLNAYIEGYFQSKYLPPVDLGPDLFVEYGFCPVQIPSNAVYLQYLWSDSSNADQFLAEKPKTYWLEAQNAQGAFSRDSIRLVWKDNPIPLKDSLICQGSALILDPGLDSAVYQCIWSTGDTGMNLAVQNTGFYAYVLIDSFGCQFHSDTAFIQVDSFASRLSLGTDTALCQGNILGLTSGESEVVEFIWNTGDTTNLIQIDSAGSYYLTAVDSVGCQATDTIIVSIKGRAPFVDFANDSACPGDTFFIQNLSFAYAPSNISSYLWSFPDSSFSNAQNPLWPNPGTGAYPIQLLVETDSGCFATTSKVLIGHQAPQALFSVPVACALTPAVPSNLSTISAPDSLSQFRWELSGGQAYNSFEPIIDSLMLGFQLLRLEVQSDKGCIDLYSDSVEAFPAINPSFSFKQSCLGQPTLFTDKTPSFSIIEWEWSLSDGAIYLAQNPSHQFASAGLFTATLKVKNAIGCENQITDTVIVNAPPVADFKSDSICLGETLFLSDSSNSQGDSIISREWRINGDWISDKVFDSIVLPDTGIYVLSLFVQTEGFCSDSTAETILVSPIPTSDFDFDPKFGEAPININFSNASIGADSFVWDFGDGSSSIEVNPIHNFLSNGNFITSLTAINDNSCTDRSEVEISLLPPNIDLTLDNLSYSDRNLGNGNIARQVRVRLINLATTPINFTELILQYGNEQRFFEQYSGIIPSGNFVDYTFNSEILINEIEEAKPLCVTADNVNINGETNLRNNEICIAIGNELQVVGPIPNPIANSLNLRVITNSEGGLNLRVFNSIGQLIFENKNALLEHGLNQIGINSQAWAAGDYILELKFKGESNTIKFFKH